MQEERSVSLAALEEEIAAMEQTAGAPAESPAAESAAAPTSETGPGEGEALRRALEEARERVTRLEQERMLLGRGVPEEDLDYYVFKIGQLTGPEKDFAAAAKEFLRSHAPRSAAVFSTGASLAGRAERPRSASDVMNRLIRGI